MSFRPLTVTVIHTDGKRKNIDINMSQIVSFFKDEEKYYLQMSVPPIKEIDEQSYNIIWNAE